MRTISDSIKKWMDWDVIASEPPKLKEDALENVKKEFEEWNRKIKENEVNEIWG